MTDRRSLVAAAVLLAIVAVALWFAFLRPDVTVASLDRAGVTIACGASSGADPEACALWGDSVLADGAPSNTFEMADLVRLELSRSAFGLGGDCRASYVISRYPDDPVWTAGVPCPES